jgi:hypothetical protein
MNDLKYFFIDFLLYYYMNFIIEEWDLLNKLGKFMIRPAWFVKSIIHWVVSPIIIPIYFLQKNQTIFIND